MIAALRRLLRSRKVCVAVATVLAAVAAEFGLHVSLELMLAIVGIGASLIGGIAYEDAAAKRAGKHPAQNDG